MDIHPPVGGQRRRRKRETLGLERTLLRHVIERDVKFAGWSHGRLHDRRNIHLRERAVIGNTVNRRQVVGIPPADHDDAVAIVEVAPQDRADGIAGRTRDREHGHARALTRAVCHAEPHALDGRSCATSGAHTSGRTSSKRRSMVTG